MSMGRLYKLSLQMQMIDKISDPIKDTKRNIEGLLGSSKQVAPNLTKMLGAAAILNAGKTVALALSDTVKSTFQTQQALSELGSLGVKELGALEKSAIDFSSKWAGTTKADFITAAYDIKSGIATLSDEGVAEYTKMAGLTAKATKSTTGEMTNLFATGYGIYKDYYKQMSDLEFGEMYSSAISKSVQIFKTDGSKMSQAIQTLGAAGTNALRPLEEQFAVLGMLQSTMGGSEAGTKYKAFFKSAAQAGQTLGLSFTDANNQLLSMPDILTKIRGKYGEVMDATEKMELQKAFGTEEAVALVDLLYGKVDVLKGNVLNLQGAMGDGAQTTRTMAEIINANSGSHSQVLSQAVQNLKETIGGTVAPVWNEWVVGLTNIVISINEFITKYPAIAKGLATFMLFGGVIAVIGASLFGVVNGVKMAATVFGKFAGTVGNFSKLSMFANPIVIGAVAIIAILFLLWKNWDTVTNYIGNAIQKLIGWFNGLSPGVQAVIAAMFPFISIPMMIIANWSTIMGFFSTLWINISTAFSNGMMNVKNIVNGAIEWFRNSGRMIMETFAAGIRGAIMAPVNAVSSGLQRIRNMLPFSDAKTGPLSTLTLSGIRTMTTISEGIRKSEGSPAKAVSHSFSKINFKENDKKAVKKIRLGSSSETPLAEGKSYSKGKEIRIGNLVLNVKLDEIEDFKKLKKLLLELEDLDFGNDGEGEVVPA